MNERSGELRLTHASSPLQVKPPHSPREDTRGSPIHQQHQHQQQQEHPQEQALVARQTVAISATSSLALPPSRSCTLRLWPWRPPLWRPSPSPATAAAALPPPPLPPPSPSRRSLLLFLSPREMLLTCADEALLFLFEHSSKAVSFYRAFFRPSGYFFSPGENELKLIIEFYEIRSAWRWWRRRPVPYSNGTEGSALHEIVANINLVVQLVGWKKDTILASTTSWNKDANPSLVYEWKSDIICYL